MDTVHTPQNVRASTSLVPTDDLKVRDPVVRRCEHTYFLYPSELTLYQ